MNKQIRQLAVVITGQNTSDGVGVKLKRIVSQQQQNAFDPFILLDEFGSDEPGDYIGGFPDHPHRGFETVTYMLAGAMLHRDHMGNEGHLRAGDVQWMTAAHGIIHSEMPEQENGLLHGFQLWINLPAKEKMNPPHYQEFAAAKIPQVELAEGGYIKVIAGDYVAETQTISGPVTGVSTRPLYFDVLLSPQQQLDIPIDVQHTVLIYVYHGELAVGATDKILTAGQLGQLISGDNIRLATQAQSTQFLVLAALPLQEPMVQSGPFVMNSREEIEQAFRDYRDGVLTR
ncbi:MAG: pirin family protein [Methylobacter sp.]|uniref:Pirin family protein n=1 Tax=Candidatus Methylobacter titanis TaxID=3053457 RepID=A0AA43Q229_9GAMM|nr:pirin family protein [Candidatus Methylobacter titanis]MDI1291850.1 pirin family protein [Candidatus Methylobacter titanis]